MQRMSIQQVRKGRPHFPNTNALVYMGCTRQGQNVYAWQHVRRAGWCTKLASFGYMAGRLNAAIGKANGCVFASICHLPVCFGVGRPDVCKLLIMKATAAPSTKHTSKHRHQHRFAPHVYPLNFSMYERRQQACASDKQHLNSSRSPLGRHGSVAAVQH
jgi:hypothetical protein